MTMSVKEDSINSKALISQSAFLNHDTMTLEINNRIIDKVSIYQETKYHIIKLALG